MTEKELRDSILLAIYNRRDKLNIKTDVFCSEENIVCKDNKQRYRIFKELSDSGYVKITFFESGDGFINDINSAGVDYVEANILNMNSILVTEDGTPFVTQDGSFISVENSTQLNDNPTINQLDSLGLLMQSQELLRQVQLEYSRSNKFKDIEKITELENKLRENISAIKDHLEQLKTLKIAYQKQADAEKSKGKKSNSTFVAEYLAKAKETEDTIVKLNIETNLINKKLTSLTSRSNKNEIDDIDNDLRINIPLEYEVDESMYFPAKEEVINIKTISVNPCFQVNFMAQKFANHIDTMTNEDSQMIGIFGKWGRGKTYFWGKVKDLLSKDKYTFIEFNAWKYQETPALWAYLYITFQNIITPKKWNRLWYNIWQNRFKVVLNLLVLALFLSVLILGVFNIENCYAKWIIGVVSLGLFISKEIKDNMSPVLDSLKKTFKSKDHSNHLGCQNEIEDDLVKLAKHFIPHKNIATKKIILYIDDIDRCDDDKMVKIIDSLRTILENPELARRLIVICAVDGDRLKTALHKKYNNKNLAREQMDKIFISGINLRPIYYNEQIEFIKQLIDTPNTNDSDSIAREVASQNHSLEPIANTSTIEEDMESTIEQGELSIFRKILTDTDASEITPRQLRVIYYRYKLANNLLDGYKIPHDVIAKSIYSKTLGREDVTNLAPSYQDIVQTVVCY